MFDWLLPEDHAIAILKKDHDTVKYLFDQFEKSESQEARDQVMQRAIAELKIHAVLEEEIFYPAIRQHVGRKMMNEADEEHHVARFLIAELDGSTGADDHRDARFTVLAENVRHHIQEEEEQVMPKARELDINFERLGERLLERKRQLQRDGVPTDAEHTMVAAAGHKADSPAAAARRKKAPVARKAGASSTAKRRTRASR